MQAELVPEVSSLCGIQVHFWSFCYWLSLILGTSTINYWNETQPLHSLPLLQDLDHVFYLHTPTYVLSPGLMCSWAKHLLKNLLNIAPVFLYINIHQYCPYRQLASLWFLHTFYFWGKIRNWYQLKVFRIISWWRKLNFKPSACDLRASNSESMQCPYPKESVCGQGGSSPSSASFQRVKQFTI